MSDEQTPPSARSVVKAIGALLIAELFVSAALLVQAAPAYFSDSWNMEATFQILEESKPVRYPVSATFETGALSSIQCDKIPASNGKPGIPLKCSFVGEGLFDAEEYLSSIGIRTGNSYSEVSSWPRWGAQSNIVWQLVLAVILTWGWLRWAAASLRDDLTKSIVFVRTQPQFLLLPYAASVVAMSLALVAVPYDAGATSAQRGLFGSDLALTTVLAAILVAPLLEEAVFRGVIYDLLNKYMPWSIASLLGSLSFMAMHSLQLAGSPNGVPQSFGILAAGLGLCWLRRRGSSLSVCILAHAIANAIMLATHYRQSLG
ncbi:hypothetical protein ASE35_07770 [Lysobacter sp. Root916]|uniref:CPBP family intramembrane glutamic endopeptidase n=1 Tax=Lysobacter sp. Root916 TaxID=1736606 RepID=UPI00070C3BFE|nr:CPBP family intramembrane glutamic endopeptidase [Lysobacter sp. Root916]KRD34639.1 hypothetical protein ASE35_07770 [Lysobacter sp. Root916]